MSGESDHHLLIAEARVARQREVIAQLKARKGDTTDAKSLLSALLYSLKLLKRHRAAGTQASAKHAGGSEASAAQRFNPANATALNDTPNVCVDDALAGRTFGT